MRRVRPEEWCVANAPYALLEPSSGWILVGNGEEIIMSMKENNVVSGFLRVFRVFIIVITILIVGGCTLLVGYKTVAWTEGRTCYETLAKKLNVEPSYTAIDLAYLTLVSAKGGNRNNRKGIPEILNLTN
jgi:hypothetical protein